MTGASAVRHTPGPWQTFEAEPYPGAPWEVWSNRDGMIAALISAAPELLDALRTILWQIENGARPTWGGVKAARAAIAKAEGAK